MSDTKRRFETLCIYDYRGVEEHLTAMAAKGWRLEKTGKPFWKYRRAEPAGIRYAVTYSEGASQFNPGPTEGQESLAELCEAAGWEKVCDWFQMQIFCTADPEAVPLETDERIRLDVIHRSMRKNFLPGNIVLLLLSLVMSALFLRTLFTDPFRLFKNNSTLFSGTMFLLAAVAEVFTLWHYYRWRRRSLRSIEEGGSCVPVNTRLYQRLNIIGLALVTLYLGCYICLEALSGMGAFTVIYLLLLLLLTALVQGTTVLLRRRGVSKRANMAGTLAVDVVLAFALVGGMVFGALNFGWFSGGSGKTYTYQHLDFDVHPRQDVPLTLSDLTGVDYQHISRTWRREGSVFLPERSYREYVLDPSEDAEVWPDYIWLRYSIYKPRSQWLYDRLVADITAEEVLPNLTRSYISADPAPWGAEAAYQYCLDGNPTDNWLLCWPGRVVELDLDWEATDQQKALIQDRLGQNT